MAVIPSSPERDAVRAEIFTELFGMPDASQVLNTWSLESAGAGYASLRIELAAIVDLETANQIINGSRPTDATQ